MGLRNFRILVLMLVFVASMACGVSAETWTIYNKSTTSNGIQDNDIRDLKLDSSGNLWVATLGGGISKFDGTNWTYWKTGEGLVNNNCWDIAFDTSTGDKWIATGNGVSKYDDTNFTNYDNTNSGLSNDDCRSVAIDDAGVVWMGSFGDGLFKLDGTTWTNYTKNNSDLPGDKVWDIAVASDDSLWVCTLDGVAHYDGTDWDVYSSELLNNDVFACEIDSSGDVWFATLKGVNKFDGTNWGEWDEGDGLEKDSCKAISVASNGVAWVGMYNGGADEFDGTNFTNYKTTNSGIAGNYVWTTRPETTDKIWLGGNNGVSLLDKSAVPPTANFTGSPTTGEEPLTVNFTDSSTGDVTSWSWTFGDGGTSTAQNPSHEYDDDDTYTVTLTVTGSAGSDVKTRTDYITVEPYGTPNAAFTADETTGDSPLTVNFTDTSTGIVSAWSWTFGDGGTSAQRHPTHVYSSDGAYTVTLIASGSAGSDTETKVNYITVGGGGPETWTTYNKLNTSSGINNNYIRALLHDAGRSVMWVGTNGGGLSKFDGTDWTLYDTSDGLVYNAVWDLVLDDSGNLWISTNNGVSKFDGTNFTNWDISDGMSNDNCRGIDVDTDGDTIWVTTNGSGVNKFDGTNWTWWKKSTSDLPNDMVKDVAIDSAGIKWFATMGGVAKFDGTNWTTYTSQLPNDDVWGAYVDSEDNKWFATIRGVSKYDGTNWTTYEEENDMPKENTRVVCVDTSGVVYAGTYGGGVCKYDGTDWTQYKKANSDITGDYIWAIGVVSSFELWFGHNAGVSVLEYGGGGGPGAPGAAFSASSTNGDAPFAVNFTDQSTGDITSWNWDFGDTSTGTAQSPAHTYNTPGTYSVSLTVSGSGGSDSLTKTDYITVNEVPSPPPNPAFTADVLEGLAPLTVYFTSQSSGCIDTYKYDFDGNDTDDWSSSSSGSTQWTYMTPGIYTVRLKVRDCETSDYYSETKLNYITVNAPIPPTALFSATPTTGWEPQTVSFWDQSTGHVDGWEWDFGDSTTSTAQNPDHVYDQGTYSVSLTASGPGGTDTLTKTSYLTIGAPAAADANFTADPTVGFSPMDVQFMDLSTGSVTEWSWDFGDSATSTAKNPVHTYSVGSYTVTLDVDGPVSSDSMTKTSYITVEQAPAGGTGLTLVDSPDDLTNTHPHLWTRGYGPNNGLWAKAQTTHAEIWNRLSSGAPTGSWGGVGRSNGQNLMRSAMAFVISKNSGFGNHCQDAVQSLNSYTFGVSIDDLECLYGYALAYDALVDDPQTTWLSSQDKADALATMSAAVQMLNMEPGATWRVRPTHNLMVLRAAAHACSLYNLRGESGYETVFNNARQYSLAYHDERVNGLCDAPLSNAGPRPTDGFPYEGPNYGAYQASRALIHRHVLEFNEYPNPDTIVDENKSGFFQGYNLAWMGIMVPGLTEWADVAYRGTHGLLQGARFYSAINKAAGSGTMAQVGEWFHNTILNSNVGTPDNGWWQGWEFIWYDASITPMHPAAAGIGPYVHLNDAEYHSYFSSWDITDPDAVMMYLRNSGHDGHTYWAEGHSGDDVVYDCTAQTGSHDGADNGHFGAFHKGKWIAYNYQPHGDTDRHNCLLIDGAGQIMDGQRGYEVPELADTDVIGIVDSDYGHALDADIAAAYSQVSDYHRFVVVIRDPMYMIIADDLESGHTVDFLCYNEGVPSRQAADLYTSDFARYQLLYPSTGYTSSTSIDPITISTSSADLAFLLHTNPSASVSTSYSGGVVTADIGSDEVVYNPSSGSYDNGTISGNAKFFAERSGSALIVKATTAEGSEYSISCDSPVSMAVTDRKASIYVYGSGTQTVTVDSSYGTDVFDIPAGQTVTRLLTGTSPDAPVADFFATPTTGWDLYFQPEFVSLSTGWITNYMWEFGDGTSSAEMAPHHKYNAAGIYTVKLTVTGPGGDDTKVKNNLITVNDFATGYDWSDYILTAATQAAFDSALDDIEDSQTSGLAPGDPNWCGVNWCSYIQHGGGGRILFDASIADSTISIDWASETGGKRDWFGDNLIIDGQDRNIRFVYTGSQPCDQTENACAMRIHGNDNVARNFTWDRFPDGLHMRGGQRNLIENVTVNTVCEDAMTFNGSGNKCIDCIARDCTYGASQDKTFMYGGGGSLSSAVICGMHSTNGNQPIRMTGGGRLVVRNSTFLGDGSSGPRFGGESNIVIFENNTSDGTRNGVRVSDKANVLIRNNTMKNCTDYGIYGFNDGYYIRAENNTLLNNATANVFCEEQGQADFGGGSLDVFRDAEDWLPAAQYPTTDVIASIGRNDFSRSGVDVINSMYDQVAGDVTMTAEDNFWDHTTVGDVVLYDVSGDVDVDPLGIDIGDLEEPDTPGLPGSPTPSNGATNVSQTTDLSWSAGTNATSHDVYFGTVSPGAFQTNQGGTTYDPGTLNAGTTYYWHIVENNAYGSTSGPVWAFTTAAPTVPPNQATSPSPANSATDVSANADLSWSAGLYATSHDVYFGTDSTPGSTEFQGNQGSNSFDPGALQYDTTYYWRIDEKNSYGTTTGTVWSFTTESMQQPAQASDARPWDSSTSVAVYANLYWADAAYAESYDVYFGTASPGASQGNQTATTFEPGTLAGSTTYYWRIDAKNSLGTTTGTVWSFTTAPALSTGSLVGWGDDGYGKVSNAPSGTDYIAVRGAHDHSVALKSDGSVVGWGMNTHGETDIPTAAQSGVIDMRCGYSWTLALKDDGTVVSWGWSDKIGYAVNSDTPTTDDILAIAAGGGGHGLVLKDDGSLFAWGYNGSPETGQVSDTPTTSDFVDVAAGNYHCLAQKTDDTIVAWGHDGYGQCNVPSAADGAIAIDAGSYYSVALKSDGSLVYWGSNSWLPTPNSGFTAIGAGGYGKIALRSDGTIESWGGGGDSPNPNTPTGSDHVAVGTGYNHWLAIDGN